MQRMVGRKLSHAAGNQSQQRQAAAAMHPQAQWHAPPHLWIHEGGCIPRHAPAPAAAPALLLLPPAAVVQGQHVFNRVEQLRGSGREVVDLPCLQLRACSSGSGNSRGGATASGAARQSVMQVT